MKNKKVTGKAWTLSCRYLSFWPLSVCSILSQKVAQLLGARSRPQICIGTDSFHTPIDLLQIVESYFNKNNYDVQINKPYSGTLVPIEFYKKDHKVISIMIEINRSLYMDERTGEKKDTFESIKKEIGSVFHLIKKFQQIIPADDGIFYA